ncbi:MAG: septal ring lytic transglycosylase RlpA family protein [Fibrobacterota bacterium]
MIKTFLLLPVILLFFGCSSHVRFTRPGNADGPAPRPAAVPATAPASAERMVRPEPQAENGGGGRVFEEGEASYYAHQFHGRKTSNGETFDMNALTAAHRTLPFNTRVRVKNMDNGQSVVVRINDRGPFARDRIIDLSLAAARAVSLTQAGHARVQLTLVE